MIMTHDDHGAGPAVVLLHAGVCDRRMWSAQVAALSRTHRVIAPDLRGFGDTPMPPQRFAHAEDVVTLLDHCGVDRATLVGASFGGRVALEVAVTSPERVAGLVLLCPALRELPSTPDADAFDQEEDRLLEAGDIEAAVRLNVATWLGPSADAAAREHVADMQRRAFEVQLAADELDPGPEIERLSVDPGRVEAPTLVVGGELDLDLFRNIARHLGASVAGARLVMLPWAAHLPSLERPDEATALIAGFLSDG